MMKASSWADKATPKVHDTASSAGKFDNGFLADKDSAGYAKPAQPAGTFPLSSGECGPMAKPTHAPGTLVTEK